MIREAWEHKKDAESCIDSTKGGNLLILGLATSLDALAVGLSLALTGENVWYPAIIIGVVCFLLSAVALHLGHTVRRLSGLGNKANILGGLILWGIGIKILHEHGVFF
jgi:putative Mn2+ efflux pump MntP